MIKTVFQTCDSRKCKNNGRVHKVLNDKLICQVCDKEFKFIKVDDNKSKKK